MTGEAGADGGSSGAGGSGGSPVGGSFGGNLNTEVDILVMIDNSPEMTEMQEKLDVQLPSFIQTLQNLPVPPSLHLAVVSSDMGAPGDSTASIACTTRGDQGEFQTAPRGTCVNTTLSAGATFISDADMMPNYTDPLVNVVQCIALLGDEGCGFEHQLASIDRALGADGLGPAPSQNVGFLRPEAALVILMLTNEDDCSAPANTTIYSLNGSLQNISNPDGPIGNYRCNGGPRGGHLCQDPHAVSPTAFSTPPLTPPSDAQGTATAPMLDLANCEDNETGSSALTPVSQFVSDIKALKSDPDSQILVAAIAAPAAPYAVTWAPAMGGQSTQPGELWPNVMHSCGAAGGSYLNPAATQRPTDGSFGDPAVRITQFTNAFPKSVLGSVCDANFGSTLGALAGMIAQLIEPNLL
ncbi:MAG TPA: hypothetical protein VLA79_07400 [Polyangia bacterium]|nr:hypothetical protein [Polyangia bacterium]